MTSNKIYSFIASPILWTKENRVTKIEDLQQAPFYEELMFEIKMNADIEPLIVAKDNKFKSDDLKAKKQDFQKNKNSLEKRIVRLESRLKKLEDMEQYVNYVYGAVSDLFLSFPKEKKSYLKEIFSGYARNGMFLQAEVKKIKGKAHNFLSNIFTSAKKRRAYEKLERFITYCEDNNLYMEFRNDPSGKSKDVFEAIMKSEKVSVTTFFAEITGYINKTGQEIEDIRAELTKEEISINLSAEGYERDNYVLIELENEIIRKYAKQMKEQLFPQEIKKEEISLKTAQPSAKVEVKVEDKSKVNSFLNQLKMPDLTNVVDKAKDSLNSIKNVFKKKN